MNENFNNYILYDDRFKFLIAVDYDKKIEIDEDANYAGFYLINDFVLEEV